MRWTSSSRPNWVRRALAWAMRVPPPRLEASTTQADRGDPQLSTTLTGTTPSLVAKVALLGGRNGADCSHHRGNTRRAPGWPGRPAGHSRLAAAALQHGRPRRLDYSRLWRLL